MAYKECSHCGYITDDDENKCPECESNPLNGKIISFEELISSIKKGEIPLSKIRTRNPDKIYQAIKGSS